MLVVCCELGQLPYDGGIMDQPTSMIKILSVFSAKYNLLSAGTKTGMMKLEKSPKKIKTNSQGPNSKGVSSGSRQGPGLQHRNKRR